MSDNTVIFWVAIARLLVAGIAAWAAFQLASEGKDGWGWMIFLAIVLGTVTIKSE